MYTRDVVVGSKMDAIYQPEAVLIQKANEYKSNIWVEVGTKKANAKSLLGVLSLGMASGTSVKISAEGEDEQVAVECLEEILVR